MKALMVSHILIRDGDTDRVAGYLAGNAILFDMVISLLIVLMAINDWL